MKAVDRLLLLAVHFCVLLVMGMPLVVVNEGVYPFTVGKAVYARVLIEVSVALCVLLAARNPAYRPRLSGILIVFAGYGAISLLASFTGVDTQTSLWSHYTRSYGVVDLLHWIAFAFVLACVLRTERDWIRVLNLALAASAVMVLLQLLSTLGVHFPMFGFPDQEWRFEGTLGNAMFVGAYALVNALVGIALLAHSFAARTDDAGQPDTGLPVDERTPRRFRIVSRALAGLWCWRIFWIACIALNLWMVSGSGTRSSYLALAVACLFMAVVYMLYGRVRIVKIVLAGLIAGIVALACMLILLPDSPPSQYISKHSAAAQRLELVKDWRRDESILSRMSAIPIGAQAFVERPILGWGPHNYIIVWGKFYDDDLYGMAWHAMDYAHNEIVEDMVGKGAIGLAAFLILWALMFKVAMSRIRRASVERALLTFVLSSAMVALFVQGLASFDTSSIMLMFVLLVGYAAHLEEPIRWGGPLRMIGRRCPRVRLDRFRVGSQTARTCISLVAWLSLTAGLLVGLLVSIQFMNVNVLEASKEIGRSRVVQTTDWQSRITKLERAGELFPPLAHEPAMELVIFLTANLAPLSKSADAGELMSIVDRKVEAELGDSVWWTTHVDLAHSLQDACWFDESYVDRAERRLVIARDMAPGLHIWDGLWERHGKAVTCASNWSIPTLDY